MRWLDLRFEPIISRSRPSCSTKLEAAEIFHQLLEHRWFMAEQAGHDVTLEEALADYLRLLADGARGAASRSISRTSPERFACRRSSTRSSRSGEPDHRTRQAEARGRDRYGVTSHE